MEFLFAEEAETFWNRQDRIWREEKIARERLMGEVVDGWKDQIKEKLKGNSWFFKYYYSGY